MKTFNSILGIRSACHPFGGLACAGAVLLFAAMAPAQNLYVPDFQSNKVYEYTPGGVRSTFASGFNFWVTGLAFDNAGDLFVAVESGAIAGLGQIIKITPGGAQTTFASGLQGPMGLAFDRAGNLFESDSGSDNIYEFTPSGVQSTFASGLQGPNGLAFNSTGDLFVVDSVSGNVYKFTTNGIQSTFATGLNVPYGLAFNSTGDLFVADSGSGNIYEFATNGVQSTFASGLNVPQFIAFNGEGILFVSCAGSGTIYEFTTNGVQNTFASDLIDPEGLAFRGVTLPPTPPSPVFLTNGLVAYYPLNGNAKDASGNGYDATSYNVSWGTNQFGIATAAGQFNGASSYVVFPPALVNVMSGTSPMAISAWVKTSPAAAQGGNNTIVDIGEASQNNMFGILSQTGTFTYSQYGGTYNVASGVSIADNSWHQCVASFDGGNLSLYVDGVFTITSPVASHRLNTRGTIGVRADLGAEFWNGGIDDVRIYSRGLSSVEVAQLYAYESQPQPPIPPSITYQPQAVTVNAGDNVSFNVTAAGTWPLNYQWSINGTNILGATASTLTISNVAQTDLGNYAVVVTNAFGTITSSNALLSMYPYLETPFAGAITYWGKGATFSVVGWGTGPLQYQWFNNGVAIQNATDPTLSYSSMQFSNAGLYTVVLSGPLGSVTNRPEQVVVNVAGVSLGFSPTLTISGVPGFTYAIQRSTNLANTNAWVTLTNLTLTQPMQLFIDSSIDATSPFNPTYFYKVLPGQ